jgi:hypothetical protein
MGYEGQVSLPERTRILAASLLHTTLADTLGMTG